MARAADTRRPLGPANLATAEELRQEIGCPRATLKPVLDRLPAITLGRARRWVVGDVWAALLGQETPQESAWGEPSKDLIDL